MKKTVASLAVLTLACGSLFAQRQKPQMAHADRSPIVIPAQDPPAGLVTIFSNLGPNNTDLYYSANGWVVSGSSAADFAEQWVGLPFTVKANSHVTRVQLALGNISGTNKFVVGIYNDNGSGAPGTVIAQFQMQNAPVFGTCCSLVTKAISGAGLAVQAGKTYWIVANSNDTTAPSFEGAWAFSNLSLAFDEAQGGWAGSNVGDFGAGQPAGAVFGTTP
jgi:hypothetical protein